MYLLLFGALSLAAFAQAAVVDVQQLINIIGGSVNFDGALAIDENTENIYLSFRLVFPQYPPCVSEYVKPHTQASSFSSLAALKTLLSPAMVKTCCFASKYPSLLLHSFFSSGKHAITLHIEY